MKRAADGSSLLY